MFNGIVYSICSIIHAGFVSNTCNFPICVHVYQTFITYFFQFPVKCSMFGDEGFVDVRENPTRAIRHASSEFSVKIQIPWNLRMASSFLSRKYLQCTFYSEPGLIFRQCLLNLYHGHDSGAMVENIDVQKNI